MIRGRMQILSDQSKLDRILASCANFQIQIGKLDNFLNPHLRMWRKWRVAEKFHFISSGSLTKCQFQTLMHVEIKLSLSTSIYHPCKLLYLLRGSFFSKRIGCLWVAPFAQFALPWEIYLHKTVQLLPSTLPVVVSEYFTLSTNTKYIVLRGETDLGRNCTPKVTRTFILPPELVPNLANYRWF